MVPVGRDSDLRAHREPSRRPSSFHREQGQPAAIAAGGDPIPLGRDREARDYADRAAQRLAQRMTRFIEQEQGGDESAGALIERGAGDSERTVGRHRESLDARRAERHE